jgi:outer membrane murein-binding lipoprotein Lpp
VEVDREDRLRLAKAAERTRGVAAAALVAIAVVASGCSGCGRERSGPRQEIPDAVSAVHELVARVDKLGERLEARRVLADDAAGACREACLTEPASLVFRGDHVECRCRTVPSLGVHRVGARGR